MADFGKYAPILKRLEGGYVVHPDDPGGATNQGVTLATYRAIFGREKTKEDLRHITDEEWVRVMRVYWDACKGDEIKSQSVADIVVDWSVNSGTAGRKGTQKALGLVADGIFGQRTLAALNKEPAKCVFCKIQEARREFYRDIVRKKPSQEVFLKGWLNRVNTFEFEE